MKKLKIEKGAQVLAQWNWDEFWYPAVIIDVEKDWEAGTYVRFADGDKQWCSEDQLLPVDIEIDDRVHARWDGKDEYFAAHVAEIKDGKYALNYEDGSKEWTTLDLIRVTR